MNPEDLISEALGNHVPSCLFNSILHCLGVSKILPLGMSSFAFVPW